MLDSFVDLYDRHFDDLYRYVYFRIGNRWDTDDLVSSVFAKAYEQQRQLRGAAKPWLFAIARNAISDFYRRGRREIPQEQLPDWPAEDQTDAGLLVAAEQDCLRQALRALAADQQELISLRYFADLRQRQIAAVLQISEAAVKMRLHRLLGQMKEMVQQCLGE